MKQAMELAIKNVQPNRLSITLSEVRLIILPCIPTRKPNSSGYHTGAKEMNGP